MLPLRATSGREDDRIRVHELRGRVVVRAERHLRLRPGLGIEPEQLLVAADARDIEDVLAVGRPRRTRVGEVVLGDVGDLLRVEIEHEDVADGALQAGEHHLLAVGREVG